MADHGAVIVYLTGGQSVRLPLRRLGRGIERPPVGYEAFEEWLGKRPDVVMFNPNSLALAVVEHASVPGGNADG